MGILLISGWDSCFDKNYRMWSTWFIWDKEILGGSKAFLFFIICLFARVSFISSFLFLSIDEIREDCSLEVYRSLLGLFLL